MAMAGVHAGGQIKMKKEKKKKKEKKSSDCLLKDAAFSVWAASFETFYYIPKIEVTCLKKQTYVYSVYFIHIVYCIAYCI